MDLITELEDEFSAMSESTAPGHISLRSDAETLTLKFPELGIDYIAGLSGERLLVIPMASVSEVFGSSIPDTRQVTLLEYLSQQRTPIRVSYRSQDMRGTCWLLNIRPGWLRVSMTKGVSWLPLGAITRLEILAVDN